MKKPQKEKEEFFRLAVRDPCQAAMVDGDFQAQWEIRGQLPSLSY